MDKIPKSIKFVLQSIARYCPNFILDNKCYKNYKKFLSESMDWSQNKILDFQNQQFIALINHCFKNVEFYKKYYSDYGISKNDIKDLTDINKIPFINKEIVKENNDKFLAKNFNKQELNKIHTGGTTSTPMHFYNTNSTNSRECAFYNRIWNKYEYKNGRCLILRGVYSFSNKLYTYNPYRNTIIVNTSHLNSKKLDDICNLIKVKKIKFVQAYPSLIYLLAKYINDNNLNEIVNGIKTIFCASEKMYDFQRKEIKKAFNCKLIDYYGHNERLVLMVRDDECGVYHIIPEYGITEVVNESGKNIIGTGKIGEIVGTGFNNYAFPLVRYKTGDMATTLSENFECKCKSKYESIKEIDGRSGDFIITKSGKYYSPTILEFAIRYINNFKDLQVIQKNKENADILIVPDKNYNKNDGLKFKQELLNRINDDINFKIKLVDHIDKPNNQKRRFIVSKVV